MSENWRRSEMCIVINDKSQGNIAKHLSWEVFIHYKFIIQFAGDKKLNLAQHLANLQAKWLIVSCALFALHFCPPRC